MQKSKRENMGILVTLVLLTAFLGQVYIRPFSEYFRFSLSVPALSLVLLYFPVAQPILYSATAGAAMLIIRGVLSALTTEGVTFLASIVGNLTVLIFYTAFGIAFTLLRIRERSHRGISLFFSLWLCEIIANLAEVLSLHVMEPQPLEQALHLIIIVGSIRSGSTAAVYRLSQFYQERHERQLREERYRRMLLFFSNIKTDLLFFHKSMDDIEIAMKYSYRLYEKLMDEGKRNEALTIARQIHEVKKDYQRISVSMERALSMEYDELPMKLSDIFEVLQASIRNQLETKGVAIMVSFSCHHDWVVERYYTIISIVNNLVINAIEAIGESDGSTIGVTAWKQGDECVIEVKDDGPGIPEDILEYIFEPGFSTRFDTATGDMYTGIGLTHVRNIVDEIYGGSVTVESGEGGTRFEVRLPVKELEGGEARG